MVIEREFIWAYFYMDFDTRKVSIYCEEYYDEVKECFSKMHPQLADQVPVFDEVFQNHLVSVRENDKFYFFGSTSNAAEFCTLNGFKYRFVFPANDGIRCESDYVN